MEEEMPAKTIEEMESEMIKEEDIERITVFCQDLEDVKEES